MSRILINRKKFHYKYKAYLTGFLFTLPVLVGIIIFAYIPAIQAFYYSFFKYDGLYLMEPIGFQNYVRFFTLDRDSAVIFLNTAVYTLINVPLSLVLGYLIALAVNNKLPGITFFRMLFYMPVVIPGVAAGILWRDLFDPSHGVMNQILGLFGMHSEFFESADSAMTTLIFTTVWSAGGSMVVWLAAFKNIPTELYESANIDGANAFKRFLNITIPLSTPMIFYNLVTGIIGSLQVFTTFIIAGDSGGRGVDDSLYFIAVKIYNEAFNTIGNMGYACAIGVILFIIIALLTMVMFKTNKWINYTEEG